MGKTRLALRYGWTNLKEWPGGVWFCDLTEARSVNGTVSVVAGVLGVPLGKGDPVAQLGHAIAGRGGVSWGSTTRAGGKSCPIDDRPVVGAAVEAEDSS